MGQLRDAEGVVLRADRAGAVVEAPGTAEGAVRLSLGGGLLAAMAADPGAAPCTGDRVSWRAWPDGRCTAERVHPRRTLLALPAAGARRQLLAANVDTVAVVAGPDRDRVDRLLALARSSGAEPVLLLVRAQAAPDAGPAAVADCPVLVLSTVTGEGFDELRGLLAGGRVLALLGASGPGAGVLGRLAGDEVARRHDPLARELHRVAGGALIDGPGLRSAGAAAGAEGRRERALHAVEPHR